LETIEAATEWREVKRKGGREEKVLQNEAGGTVKARRQSFKVQEIDSGAAGG
jgi:hypothetical protein